MHRRRGRPAIVAVLVMVALGGGTGLIVSGAVTFPGLLGQHAPTASEAPATSMGGAAIDSFEPSPSVEAETLSQRPTSQPSTGPSATPFPPLAAGDVPILYMHRVVAPPAAWLTWTDAQRRAWLAYDVLPAAFAAQLDWLTANGYTAILPRDLASHWDDGKKLPPRPVIITFDDGDHSWTRTILPLLVSHHMVAEFYLTLSAIANGEISWAEVRELKDAGMSIGAHDVHHVQLAELGAGRPDASPTTMWYEISQVRTVIDQEIGTVPDSMAYVGGGFDATLLALVQQAGYTTARSILRGIDESVADRFALRVIAVAPHDDVADVYTGQLVPGLPIFVAKMTGAMS